MSRHHMKCLSKHLWLGSTQIYRQHLLGGCEVGICILDPLCVQSLIELTKFRLGERTEEMRLRGGGTAEHSSESLLC